MIPFVGSLQFIPFLAAFVFLAVLGVTAAALWSSLVSSLGGPVIAGFAAFGIALAVLLVAESSLRFVDRRRRPKFVVNLHTLAANQKLELETIGGKGLGVARLQRLGVPTPEGVVLTSSFVSTWLGVAATRKDDPWSVLPPEAKRQLEAFLHSCRGSKIIVRASFAAEDREASHPGVFQHVKDVDAGHRAAVAAAVLHVCRSAEAPSALEYRRRKKVVKALPRAVLLQRQVDGDVTGVVQSRSPDGRTDCTVIDYARRRSPIRSVRYDLVRGEAVPIAPSGRLAETPGWMTRLSLLALALDEDVGGCVQLEFAVVEEQLWILQVRQVGVPKRKCWLSSGGPLTAPKSRLTRLVREVRGGPEVLAEAMRETIRVGGLGDGPTEDELREVHGVRFVEVTALRRALAQQARTLLLRTPLFHVINLIGPVLSRGLSKVPAAGSDAIRAWSKLRSWHRRNVAPLARDQARYLVRRWMMDSAASALRYDFAEDESRRMRAAFRWILERRARTCAAEIARITALFGTAEQQLPEAVAEVLGRAAQGWSGMFIGDGFRHASLAELDRWVSDPSAREAMGKDWAAQADKYAEGGEEPPADRMFEPPLVRRPEAESKLRVIGLVDGVANSHAAVVLKPDEPPYAGTIVVLPDGRADFRHQVLSARGVVLTGGGTLSPMATLAAELGVPAVVCVDATPVTRFPNGHPIAIDGRSGVVRF